MTGEKLSAVGDFILERSGSFRRRAISPGRLWEAFPIRGKCPEALRGLSQQGENVWKTSGCFPQMRTTKTNAHANYIKDNIPVCNREMLKQVQHDRGEAFAMTRFRPEDFGMLSQCCDFVRKTLGSFPTKGKTSGNSQEAFPTVGKRLEALGKLSQQGENV
jgi:hypothetical protein